MFFTTELFIIHALSLQYFSKILDISAKIQESGAWVRLCKYSGLNTMMVFR